jgi:hypothetical protein
MCDEAARHGSQALILAVGGLLGWRLFLWERALAEGTNLEFIEKKGLVHLFMRSFIACDSRWRGSISMAR